MSVKKIPNIIKSDLTPDNASEKGYKYVDDVIDPYEAVRELIELAERGGYIFGTPTRTISNKSKIGLYKKQV